MYLRHRYQESMPKPKWNWTALQLGEKYEALLIKLENDLTEYH